MKRASMNHIYRLVWSEASGTYVAVAEHASGRGKRRTGVLAVALMMSASAIAQTLPTGGNIVAGQGTIVQSGRQMTITQASQRMVANWAAFNIGTNAEVRFNQPGTDSVALNRVTGGGAASTIDGKLSANGNVWLINPSGVVFGKSAQVNVGGLVASSLQVSDADFLAGRGKFTGGSGAGQVINNGNIQTGAGGVVALIAPRASNTGSISTPGGSTVLAGGDAVRLDFTGDGLVGVSVERGLVEAAAENSGHISATGGSVTLSARGVDSVLGGVVNNTGLIEARGLVSRNGRILLDGDATGGSTHVSGTLDASSADGRGGSIVVGGKFITLDGGALLDASGATGGGTISVGGGWQGKDTSIANATTVSADRSVVARANATGEGDGGTVVFWSDGTTRFTGQIAVRGGENGGNGGKAEVSGAKDLVYDGVTDARASKGVTGNLLLDPETITVKGGEGTGGAWQGAVTTTGAATVYEKTLEAQSANILLQASKTIAFDDLTENGGDGVITLKDGVSFRAEVEGGPLEVPGKMTFRNKDNELVVSGTGSIYLQAGQSDAGRIENVFKLTAKGRGSNPSPKDLPGHDVNKIGNGTPAPGSITLLGADGLTIAGAITTNGGYVRLSADSDLGGVGDFKLTTPVTTQGGNLYVSFGKVEENAKAELMGDITLGAGRLYFGDAIPGDLSTKALGWSTGEKILGAKLILSGDVDFSTPLTLKGGASIYTDSPIHFSSSVKFDTEERGVTLRATDIDFSRATLTNVSKASIILEPSDPASPVALGSAGAGIARAEIFDRLRGVKNLTVGREDGTGTITVPATGIAAEVGGTFKLLSGQGNIDILGTLTNSATSGRIVVQAGHDLTLAPKATVVASGTGDAVILAAGQRFIDKNPSARALVTPHGRWLVYSAAPDTSQQGGLVNAFKQYNAHYLGGAASDQVQGTGNGFLYSIAPTIDIALVGEVRKEYDRTTTAPVTDANLTHSGTIDGDTVVVKRGPASTATYDTWDAGTNKLVTVTDIELDSATKGPVKVYGYQWNSSASANIGVIDKRKLTLDTHGSATAEDKVYDGNRSATVTGVSFVNVVNGDVLTATGTGTFDSKDAGRSKRVDVTDIQVFGPSALNYEVVSDTRTTATASITPKLLTATGLVESKVYDGDTSAVLSGLRLTGVVPGEDDRVTVRGTVGSFDTKEVGNDKVVTGSGLQLTGDGAGNYLFEPSGRVGTGSITPIVLPEPVVPPAVGPVPPEPMHPIAQTPPPSVPPIAVVTLPPVAPIEQVTPAPLPPIAQVTPPPAAPIEQIVTRIRRGVPEPRVTPPPIAPIAQVPLPPVTPMEQVTPAPLPPIAQVTLPPAAPIEQVTPAPLPPIAQVTLPPAAPIEQVTPAPLPPIAQVTLPPAAPIEQVTPAPLPPIAQVTLPPVAPIEQVTPAPLPPIAQVTLPPVVPIEQVTPAPLPPIAQVTPPPVAPIEQVTPAPLPPIAQVTLPPVAPIEQVTPAPLPPIAQVTLPPVAPIEQVTPAPLPPIAQVTLPPAAPIEQVTPPPLPPIAQVTLPPAAPIEQVTPAPLPPIAQVTLPPVAPIEQVTPAPLPPIAQVTLPPVVPIAPVTPSPTIPVAHTARDTNEPVGINGPAATNGTRMVPARSIDVVPSETAGNLVPAPLQFHASSDTAGHSRTEAAGQSDAASALNLSNHVLTGGGHISLATNDDALTLPLTNSMSVYSLRTGQAMLQPEGHYAVTDQGDTVSLKLVGASRPSEVQGRQTDLATALASVAMHGGEMLSLRTTRHANGLLTVHVPEPGAHLSADTITAYALVIARKRLGVSVQAVRSVVVNYDTRTAGIEAVRVSSAGSH